MTEKESRIALDHIQAGKENDARKSMILERDGCVGGPSVKSRDHTGKEKERHGVKKNQAQGKRVMEGRTEWNENVLKKLEEKGWPNGGRR